jgi:hypothetical protein
MGHRIYLAAAYERNDEMRGVRDVLVALGYEVTSRWIDQEVSGQTEAAGAAELAADPAAYVKFAHKDLDDLRAADTVISFTGGGGRGGRHVEFGIAHTLGKRLVLVGLREHVFHTLPEVEWYPDWTQLAMAWPRI